MIYLGLSPAQKQVEIERYAETHGIARIVVLSPPALSFSVQAGDIPIQQVAYAEIIEYATYYPLMQALDSHSLLVINECLRVQNRYDLTYNCIRNYVTQTPHRLIFQTLPIVSSREDIMVLHDWERGERYLREPFSENALEGIAIQGQRLPIRIEAQTVSAPAGMHDQYAALKTELASQLRASRKTPLEVLPRKLYKVGRPARLAKSPSLPALSTFTQKGKSLGYGLAPALSTVVDLPLSFAEFNEYIARTSQHEFNVIGTDLKADQWFAGRYAAWQEELAHAYATTHL